MYVNSEIDTQGEVLRIPLAGGALSATPLIFALLSLPLAVCAHQARMQTKFTLVVLAVVAALSQAFVPSANSRWAARTQSRHAERVAPRAMLVMSEVEGKLKEIVAEQLGVEESSITAEANFAADLGADSLDVVSSRAVLRARRSPKLCGFVPSPERGTRGSGRIGWAPGPFADSRIDHSRRAQVEMVMKIEEAFNIELPDERAEEVQNLSDAVRVVTELMDA